MSTLTTEQSSSGDPKFETFMEWCKDAVEMCCVDAKDMGEQGRGLVAAKDLEVWNEY